MIVKTVFGLALLLGGFGALVGNMPFLRTVVTLWWGFGVVYKVEVLEFSILLVPECCSLLWRF